MSNAMYRKLIFFILTLSLFYSCSKKEIEVNNIPSDEEKAFEIYREAVDLMNSGDILFASKKFSEAELILPEITFSAKASLMSGFCLYTINFYPEAIANFEKFILKYPAHPDIPYAEYMITISHYEQILDEKKDIKPLLITSEKIKIFLEIYPRTDYALDLKFKLDLINNQLAAKELYVAKYYIKKQKWIPAINRLKNIVQKYDETPFIEEALFRLVEIYYKVGLVKEAKATAVLLGYNYNSSQWYEQSYKILNKKYKLKKISNTKKNNGLIKKTIKKILTINK